MPKFKYTALDNKGKESSGTLDAENQTLALTMIREKGLFPTNVAEVGAPAGKSVFGSKTRAGGGMFGSKTRAGGGAAFGSKTRAGGGGGAAGGASLNKEIQLPQWMQGGVKPKQLTALTRQLATLVNSGLPLVRGLRILQNQEKTGTLKRILTALADSIEQGSTFAEALAQHPKVFTKLFVSMVKAGEVGGILDQVLKRLAEFMEKAQKIKNKVIGAMVYPVVVLVMAFAIVAGLLIFVIPKFREIFDEILEGDLPLLTQFTMGASAFLISNILYIIGFMVLVVIGVKMAGRTVKGRVAIDYIKFKAPLFGPLIRKTAVGRFTRTLGTLMHAGVPVLQALNIVRDTAGNEMVAQAVTRVHDAVKEGENMAPSLAAAKAIFPPLVVSMVEVGEETGELPEMLNRIAETYDDEVDNAVAGLTSAIEPILIIFLAVVVGTIVISLFLPLISIIGDLQK